MSAWSKNKLCFAILLLSLIFNCAANATCYDDITSRGPNIVLDLSERVKKNISPTWMTTVYTNFPSRSFKCSGGENLKYQSALKKSGGVLIGFQNGTYWIRVEIISMPESIPMKSGSHQGAEVNTPITMRFTLENGSGPDETKFQSSVALLKNFVNVFDDSGMSWLEWLGSIFSSAYYLVAGAPDWKRNMFTQNLELIYTPTSTTCKLDNPGLTVTLPDVSISSVTAVPRAGYTPFNLNFSCANLHGNGVADRAVDIFLSSNDLGTQDTYLIDQRPGAAQGVGIMLVTADDPSTPVIFSRSSIIRGRGTSIHSLSPGSYTPDRFTASMGAFYFPFAPNKVSIGPLKASAIVNIIYP